MTGAVFCLLAALAAVAPKAEIRNVRISSPKLALSRERADSPVLVVGQFKVEMSFAEATARKPVVRLSCLCEVHGELVVNTLFLDRPGTVSGLGTGEILQSYKDSGLAVGAKDREAKCSDPAQFTPCLREVPRDGYASAVWGVPGIRKGFFRLGKSEKMPRLLLYRIEVWQNGVQVAKYESSHAGLGTLSLPEDWHAWKKYPQRFLYSSK